MKALRPLAVLCLALLLSAVVVNQPLVAAPGDAAATPGEFVVEHPTLINLGFEWHIDGDGNRNAGVEVSFRRQGESSWRRGNSAASIFNVNTNTNYSSSDYNGFRPNPGADVAFQWNSPLFAVPMITADDRDLVKVEPRRFATLEEYARATKQDHHSLTLDYDVFVNVPKLDAKDLLRIQRLYKAADVDFRLKPGSAAVDRGVALPNITDGFSGQAPDLGALEVGQAAPTYGPRPQ